MELWVATEYKVKYYMDGGFYSDIYGFAALMCSLGIELDPEDGTDQSLDFEVRREDWEEAIRTLEKDEQEDDVLSALSQLDMSREDAVEVMKDYLENAQSNDDWLHFAYVRF